jgi:hypothetical protein
VVPTVVGGLAAWRGEEIARDADWSHRLTGLDRVVDRVRALAADVRRGDRTLAGIGRADAEVAPVTELAEVIRAQLIDGRGFALVRGLPVDRLDDVENQVLYWMIGVHVGIPLHQNEAHDVLIRVRDEGRDFDEFGVRAYETSADLEYHTDSSDVVGLYCLRPAMTGGTSTIVSSVTVHDEMVRRRPDLAALLHEPWPCISPVGGEVTWKPICAVNDRGALFTRYGRKYTELAPLEVDDVKPLTDDQVAALDLFDEITSSPEMVLTMDFRPGDVQFLNNTSIMHARTGYADWPDEHRRRELLRMWLVFREDVELPAPFRDVGFVSRALAADPGSTRVDGTKV